MSSVFLSVSPKFIPFLVIYLVFIERLRSRIVNICDLCLLEHLASWVLALSSKGWFLLKHCSHLYSPNYLLWGSNEVSVRLSLVCISCNCGWAFVLVFKITWHIDRVQPFSGQFPSTLHCCWPIALRSAKFLRSSWLIVIVNDYDIADWHSRSTEWLLTLSLLCTSRSSNRYSVLHFSQNLSVVKLR